MQSLLVYFSLASVSILLCHVAAHTTPLPEFLAAGGETHGGGRQDPGTVRRDLRELVGAQGGGSTRTKLHLVGGPKEDYGHWAGYITLANGASRLLYMYFQSRNGPNNTDPLVLWLNGGPARSSLFGLFTENGPYVINNDNTSVSWRAYGWDKLSNIIFLDQPVGSGLSYSTDVVDKSEYAEDTYDFLQQFLGTFPEVAKRLFFVTGESFAGKYIPLIAQRIIKGNRKRRGNRINLKGIAIGNPYIQPYNVFKSYPEFVYSKNKMTKRNYTSLNKEFEKLCGPTLKYCAQTEGGICIVASAVCRFWLQKVLSATGSGNPNYYDIRQDCVFPDQGCYDSSSIYKFLNLSSTRKALGVPEEISWQGVTSLGKYGAYAEDAMDKTNALLGVIKAGVRTLIYSGDADIVCNWIGTTWMLKDLKWAGQAAFNSAKKLPFQSDKGVTWGLSQRAGVLTFLKVYNAGHMVPKNQPEAAFEMIRRFVGGKVL